MLITDYIKKYGKLTIDFDNDKSFYCNGINGIGGKFKVKEFKTKGIF